MYCQCNGVHPYIRNLKYLIQPLATSHRKFTGFSVVKFLQGTSLRMNSFNISMLVEMKKWDECVLCIHYCVLVQMQHPIQMKPADSEKRGKCCIVRFALWCYLLLSVIII